MVGVGLPTPGVFGKASPQIRRAGAGRGGGPHHPPRTATTSRRGGTAETAPELPTPLPPHSSILQEQGREVNFCFRKLTKQND